MILLFEEYHYSQTILEKILEGLPIPTSTLRNNQAKVQCVGYFYSKSKEDSVFILPKVFIKSANKINVENEVDEILAFGRYKPEDIVFLDVDKSKKLWYTTIADFKKRKFLTGTRCWCGSMAEQLICNQQVDGSTPFTSSNGGFPERPKGADCKSVVTDFGGPNPPSPTRKKHLRKQVLFSTKSVLSDGINPTCVG